MKLYKDYNCPAYKTPRRIMQISSIKNFIEQYIAENNYQVERVIKYDGKDLFVNFQLAIRYLEKLDSDNLIDSGFWIAVNGIDAYEDYIDKLSEPDENDKSEDDDYYDILF